MNVFGNPVLSKAMMYSSLLLSDDALYYRVQYEKDCHEIYLTDNERLVLDLMDIDYESFKGAEKLQSFRILAGSHKVKLAKFYSTKSSNSCKDIELFKNYLNETQIQPKEFIPISLSKLTEIFPDLNDKIEESLKVLSTKEIIKFDGIYILSVVKDFDKRKFQELFPKFWSRFSTPYERKKYLISNSIEKVLQDFLELSL